MHVPGGRGVGVGACARAHFCVCLGAGACVCLRICVCLCAHRPLNSASLHACIAWASTSAPHRPHQPMQLQALNAALLTAQHEKEAAQAAAAALTLQITHAKKPNHDATDHTDNAKDDITTDTPDTDEVKTTTKDGNEDATLAQALAEAQQQRRHMLLLAACLSHVFCAWVAVQSKASEPPREDLARPKGL